MLALIREHGDALEADLQREYGIDLADVYRGTLSLRRLRVLVDGLPYDSRTARALGEVDERLMPWSLTTALLARLVDETAALRWEYEAAHLKPHERRAEPKSVLPDLQQARSVDDADVVVLRPHELREFMSDFDEGV